eukprot:9490862-Pyramimonas_sp.AAC.2
MTPLLAATMMVALVSAAPTSHPVPQWVADIAETNIDQSYWGQVQFAVSTAHSLLRSGWQGQRVRIADVPPPVSRQVAAAGLASM